MSRRTALQQAIEYLEAQRSCYEKDATIDPNYEALVYNHISALTKLLPAEKDQIEQAYDEGWVKGYEKSDFKSGHSYFQANYKNTKDVSKQTAMSSLIKMLTLELNAVTGTDYWQRTAALKMAIKFAQMKLVDEREQIEDAFKSGELYGDNLPNRPR